MLESYVTKTRDKDAALRFMKKTLKRHGPVEAITPDGLRSYKAAMNELGNQDKQEIGSWANNRVENSGIMAQTPLEIWRYSASRRLIQADGTPQHSIRSH